MNMQKKLQKICKKYAEYASVASLQICIYIYIYIYPHFAIGPIAWRN